MNLTTIQTNPHRLMLPNERTSSDFNKKKYTLLFVWVLTISAHIFAFLVVSTNISHQPFKDTSNGMMNETRSGLWCVQCLGLS